ncbi:hypothetical protein [Microtetraspora malaysiensis]|uniref:hypothetical protein n=1 Tax=Microtetraspora malaysiensis TaxID=161358 RepID=UPI003D945997
MTKLIKHLADDIETDLGRCLVADLAALNGEDEAPWQWIISDAAGDGWCAVRRTNLPPQRVARGEVGNHPLVDIQHDLPLFSP